MWRRAATGDTEAVAVVAVAVVEVDGLPAFNATAI
jgi:hypothetical protein